MSQSASKFKAKLNNPTVYEAFNKLKNALISSPVLAYPDFTKPFIIQCDASNSALGAVIGQMVNNRFRPVMYGSRHLTATETRYSATEKELLAVIWSAKRFQPYIYDRYVTFITDHQPLVTMRTLKDPMGRIGRLLNKIQDLDYTLVYQPGSSNVTADFLSRPPKETQVNYLELQLQASVNWLAEQSQDPCIRKLAISIVENGGVLTETPNGMMEAGRWGQYLCNLIVLDGILYYTKDGLTRVVVPSHLVEPILKLNHDSIFAGHRDYEKTFQLITSRYFWPLMASKVEKYCKTCHLCQTRKHLGKPLRAPLKPIVVRSPWSLIGIDVTGPLKRTPDGNLYIIVAVDYFTKFCIAKAIPDFTSATTARFLFEEVICRFGMPKSIISDHGVNFTSNLFAQLCQLCQVKRLNSSVYHPAGNGLVERMN